MPLNADSTLSDHAMQNAIGQIDKAWIDGNRLMIAGYLWDKNFGPLVDRLRQQQGALGLSYELSNAAILDQNAPVWQLTDWEWTGASCLLRSKEAYKRTTFAVAASWGACRS